LLAFSLAKFVPCRQANQKVLRLFAFSRGAALTR